MAMSIYYNNEENLYDLYLNEMYDKRYRLFAQAVYTHHDCKIEIESISLLPDIKGTGRLYGVAEEEYTRYAVERFWDMITPEALDKARQDLIDTYQELIDEFQAEINRMEEKINAINARD